MGNFYTNITLMNATAFAAVRELVTLGRDAFVADVAPGCVVYDRHCETQDTEMLAALAERLATLRRADDAGARAVPHARQTLASIPGVVPLAQAVRVSGIAPPAARTTVGVGRCRARGPLMRTRLSPVAAVVMLPQHGGRP